MINGGGGKKSISTVKQMYLMCRKYAVYNGIRTNQFWQMKETLQKIEMVY